VLLETKQKNSKIWLDEQIQNIQINNKLQWYIKLLLKARNYFRPFLVLSP